MAIVRRRVESVAWVGCLEHGVTIPQLLRSRERRTPAEASIWLACSGCHADDPWPAVVCRHEARARELTIGGAPLLVASLTNVIANKRAALAALRRERDRALVE